MKLEKKNLLENKEEESANKLQEFYDQGPLFIALGYICSFTAVVLIVTGDTTAQVLQGKVSVFQLNCHRYIFQALFMTPILLFKQIKPVIQGWTIAWTLLSALFGQLLLLLLYSALILIPLGSISAIYNSATMWLSILLSRIFLKDKINIIKVLAVSLSTVGIICVLQPPGLFPTTSVQADENTNDSSDFIFNNRNITKNGTNLFLHDPVTFSTYHFASSSLSSSPSMIDLDGNSSSQSNATSPSNSYFSAWSFSAISGYLLTVGAGSSQAAYMVLRPAKLHHISTPLIAFWNSIIGILASLCLLFAFSTPVFFTDAKSVALIIGNAITSGLLGPFFTAAITFLPPTTVSSIMPTQIILMFILQYTLLSGEFPMSINAIEVVGAVLVTVAVFMTPFFLRFNSNCWKAKSKTEGSQG